MSTLIIKDYGISLRYRKGLLLICKNGQILKKIALANIEQIIIVTSGVMISSKLVRAIIRANIDLIFLDHKGEPIARLDPPYHTKTILTRRLQYEAYNNSKGVQIAKALAYAKVRNQAGMLRYIARNRSDLSLKEELREVAMLIDRKAEEIALIQAKCIDHVRNKIINLEAEAARLYWSTIANLLPEELEFTGRNQEGEDVFNKMLNYGYGILKIATWRALLIVGLDPYAGYLHVDRSGRPSLILDFMEQFRQPIVDRTLFAMVSREKIEPEKVLEPDGRLTSDFRAKIASEILKKMENKVRYHDEKIKLNIIIKRQARKLARYLRGEENKYTPCIERW